MASAPTWRYSPCQAANCRPPSSLSTTPERRLLATAVPPPGRPWLAAAPCFVSGVFQKLFSSVSSVCCNDYMYVENICFNCFRRMFHVFHLYVSCILFACFMCFILCCICCNDYTCMFQV
jgi:hypothetical protein